MIYSAYGFPVDLSDHNWETLRDALEMHDQPTEGNRFRLIRQHVRQQSPQLLVAEVASDRGSSAVVFAARNSSTGPELVSVAHPRPLGTIERDALHKAMLSLGMGPAKRPAWLAWSSS